MADLPDPTADLDWSGYRGAIQDVFSTNAEEHPDATCVVETESSTTPQRTFSYKAINEACNALAHHLIRQGVKLGDVVMVYAYRGVDLVVAVMGVLKAGGTFSVIDPLYPPERQKVYLEVAQPKALINIRKATDEAGPLSHLVRSYIDEFLHLKVEVPALRLLDDGQLAGLTEGVKSVHAPVREHPGVLVGPDSNPTLSFTSGSEGRPKGVLGRHYSLTYYFPWMEERFNLSDKDKFTMLSGIAHDPIQRDIFTPLFLGAHLLVPAKEDIQHERLAEWMKRFEPTVTHLTPAMGQILVGGATAEFPSLRNAFFVGDILTKRDCSLLRALAVNVNIINMYGTTETQRAVSYFEIPSRARDPSFRDSMKEVIPAGRGMKNVQLLVVDRSNRMKICPVGEVGEIFVRAAGLSEGYLGDPSLNEKKFVLNWFLDPQTWAEKDTQESTHREREPWRSLYKGPRDRLYRTGDLGRYLPSGDVECCGRADDQVKIRGFRIELGDINSQLSQHRLIRDCVTLLRRDKVEEPTLVSYIVPEFTRWEEWLTENGYQDSTPDESMAGMLRRFRPLQDELRRHLKGKLPSYAVPTNFIPMMKFPLNPNGKVDKPALPFPDIVEITAVTTKESEERWKSLSETQRMVATIWGELIQGCNPKAVRPDDSFFDLGGHSILAQQMLLMVRRKLKGANVPMASLFQDPTLKGFSASLDQIAQPEANGITKSAGDGQKTVEGHYELRESEYSADARKLAQSLPSTFPSPEPLSCSRPIKVFLTGASGFLGAFLLRDLLDRQSPEVEVVAHVRAKSAEAALQRIQNSCTAYGIWKPEWQARLACVTGSLGEPKLGIADDAYGKLLDEVDVIIHNGAQVHWVYPYTKLRPANVHGTVHALQMCASGKPKQFAFVSSTSVLDNEHYVQLSERALQSGGAGVLESDDLEGSSTGLSTGYGQSKWTSEYLVRKAGKRGLRGTTIRPGYILGDSQYGITNTDDFLIRMLKGCIQLSSRPHITNTVNMVPADHVARVVVAGAFHPPVAPLGVVHVTSHPRLHFNEFLSALAHYGYNVREVDYSAWRDQLEKYVADGPIEKDYEQHALMPLYHFVTNDLPANTRASELDDRNAVASLQADAKWTDSDVSAGSAVTKETIGKYLQYLVSTRFLEAPEGKGAPMPEIALPTGQKVANGAIGGRGRMPA